MSSFRCETVELALTVSPITVHLRQLSITSPHNLMRGNMPPPVIPGGNLSVAEKYPTPNSSTNSLIKYIITSPHDDYNRVILILVIDRSTLAYMYGVTQFSGREPDSRLDYLVSFSESKMLF